MIVGSVLGCVGGVAIAVVVYYVVFHSAAAGGGAPAATPVGNATIHAPDGEAIEAPHTTAVEVNEPAAHVQAPSTPTNIQRPVQRPLPPTAAVVDTAPWWATVGAPPPPTAFVSSPLQQVGEAPSQPSELVSRRVKELNDSTSMLDAPSPHRSSIWRDPQHATEDSGNEDLWFEPDEVD